MDRDPIQALAEDFQELRLSVARIETTFAIAQERFYEKMAQITDSLDKIQIFNSDIEDLRSRLNNKKVILDKLNEKEHELEVSIVQINDQVIHINRMEKIIDRLNRSLYFILLLYVILGFLVIYHILF